MSNPSHPAGVATPGDPAAALHRQIDMERRLLEQLRGVREYQAHLLRDYSKAHGYLVPLTVEQFLRNEKVAA